MFLSNFVYVVMICNLTDFHLLSLHHLINCVFEVKVSIYIYLVSLVV
jgi:hypothetical protein